LDFSTSVLTSQERSEPGRPCVSLACHAVGDTGSLPLPLLLLLLLLLHHLHLLLLLHRLLRLLRAEVSSLSSPSLWHSSLDRHGRSHRVPRQCAAAKPGRVRRGRDAAIRVTVFRCISLHYVSFSYFLSLLFLNWILIRVDFLRRKLTTTALCQSTSLATL
jgi:hypothetical protein